MFADFAFQARFDSVSIFPITPNTSLLKFIEERAAGQAPDAPHRLQFHPCLSEESGNAWLTGSAVRGKRSMMAQGSQSLAQIHEFMNINPGLHLPILMLELTRALSPGTTTMTGSQTRDGHISRREPLNFLKYAEKHYVQGAVASTVHLADLYKKIKWGHDVVRNQKKPFLLRGEWNHLAQEMGFRRFHWAFAKSMFSIHRATIARLIKWEIPREAGH